MKTTCLCLILSLSIPIFSGEANTDRQSARSLAELRASSEGLDRDLRMIGIKPLRDVASEFHAIQAFRMIFNSGWGTQVVAVLRGGENDVVPFGGKKGSGYILITDQTIPGKQGGHTYSAIRIVRVLSQVETTSILDVVETEQLALLVGERYTVDPAMLNCVDCGPIVFEWLDSSEHTSTFSVQGFEKPSADASLLYKVTGAFSKLLKEAD